MEKTNRANKIKPTNKSKKLNVITNKKRRNKMEPKYVENLSEPWFTLIQLGLKTVEGRKNKGKFKEMKVGDIIEWKNEDFKPRSFLTQITGKVEYPNFKTYLETEGLKKCLPNMEKYGIEHGLSVYYKYYTKEDEHEFGVIAIRLKVI